MRLIAGLHSFRRIAQVLKDAELKTLTTTQTRLLLGLSPSPNKDSEIPCPKQCGGHFPRFRVIARPKAKGQCGGQWRFRNSAHHGASATCDKNFKIISGSFDDLDSLALFFLWPAKNLPRCIARRLGDDSSVQ